VEYWNHIAGPGERIELRARAVRAVLEGEKKTHVARRYGITRQTLHTWVNRHRVGGADALVPKPAGRAPRQVLEAWQEAQVADAIRALPPWTVQEHYTRWTKKAVAAYVEQSFGVRFSPWQVDSHLRRWGFGSHKEARRAFMNTTVRGGRGGLAGGNAGRGAHRGDPANPKNR